MIKLLLDEKNKRNLIIIYISKKEIIKIISYNLQIWHLFTFKEKEIFLINLFNIMKKLILFIMHLILLLLV